MATFRDQINSDIAEYQEKHPLITHIHKDEWAFNYWVLDKLFFEDEEIIESKIIDYHDMGIDAFEIYEDTKDIYLIQNKYYSDTTGITAGYVKNDFLLRAITALENGTYTKSEELQNAFSKFKNDPDFTVYLQLYVTNNLTCAEADNYIKSFNLQHPKYRAQIYYLDDIRAKYYNEAKQVKKNLTAYISSVNGGTVLNINNDAYKLQNVIDAKYIFAPIVTIYEMYEKAKREDYPIFDKNIREFLGNTGVNKKIYATLLDENDRKNFFYYNNGITIICDQVKKSNKLPTHDNLNIQFEILNPQVVNGCQTVNSIYEVLKNINPSELYQQFKDAFVMLKILEIDRNDISQQVLYQNIVRYNNSQNSIDEKSFAANTNSFYRLQETFENKGFLLLVKQSDKHTFSTKYKTITPLKEKNYNLIKKFGLREIKKASDTFIPLEKLLQVINAFVAGGQVAYNKKSSMLKYNSEQYNIAIKFIQNVTTDTLLDLFLLYKKAEETKNAKADSRAPIPYYLVDCFARYECKERTKELISTELSSNEKIEKIIKLYKGVSKAYTKEYEKKYGVDYNKMIKQPIQYEILDSQREVLVDIL